MNLRSVILGTALTCLLPTVHSSPLATAGCVTGLASALRNPECLPLKAEDVDTNPPPKFVFSTGYCTNFASYYSSVFVNIDSIPAGQNCSLTSYSLPNCQNAINTSPAPGCIKINLLPTGAAGTAISATLDCF